MYYNRSCQRRQTRLCATVRYVCIHNIALFGFALLRICSLLIEPYWLYVQTSLSYNYIHYTHTSHSFHSLRCDRSRWRWPPVHARHKYIYWSATALTSCEYWIQYCSENVVADNGLGKRYETIDDSKTENLEILDFCCCYYVYCVRSAICRRQMDFNIITNYSRKRTFVRTHNAINFNTNWKKKTEVKMDALNAESCKWNWICYSLNKVKTNLCVFARN